MLDQKPCLELFLSDVEELEGNVEEGRPAALSEDSPCVMAGVANDSAFASSSWFAVLVLV